MDEKQPAVYMMASNQNGTLYIGVTSNLKKRVWEHKEGFCDGFCKQHKVTQLVFFELHSNMYAAITREKQIKKWKREWKLELIEKLNPQWRDLWDDII